VTVVWSNVSGAESYMVYHKLPASAGWTASADLGDVLAYTITGLTECTAYMISVTAIANAGSSIKSSSLTTVTASNVPIAITGLAEVSKTDGQATVSWTQVSCATSYVVHYNINGQTAVLTQSTSSTAATIAGLTASTSYDISVTAVNSVGTSPQSSTITVSTNAASVSVPTAPTGLTAISKTDVQITM